MELVDFELRDLAPDEGDALALSWEPSDSWIPAIVPGGVHESLLAADRIPNPLAGDNEPTVRWIEDRDWWYRARFAMPDRTAGEHVRLGFDGLDTIVDLWLDGVPLGHHENQFRPASFDLTDVAAGEHVLLLRFSPPLPDGLAEGEEPGGVGPRGPMRRVRDLRKAAFSWGWDFGPRLPGIGSCGPVHLDVIRGPIFSGHHVTMIDLAPDHSRATVRMRAEIEGDGLSVAFTLTSPVGVRLTGTAPVLEGVATLDLELDDPELWWTHDLGDQPLYAARMAIADGDTVEDRVGLRTIELDRSDEPVEGGHLFRFVLNGVPLFVRGANWVPPSPFVNSVELRVYRDLVLRAREGNLTMLRVWGGGIYERDDFYSACDELGVLVWQDFMFACVDYPGDSESFHAEVDAEARYQVARLRNHPCLALWCGNNEVEIINLIRNGGQETGDWGRRIFHDLLPAIVNEIDGSAHYWPGSPWGDGGPEAVNGVHEGDRHDWEVWHGLYVPGLTQGDGQYATPGDARHYRRYADDTGRFVSEFGVLSAPDRSTLDRWLPGVGLHDEIFEIHDHDFPSTKSDELFDVTTGIPSDMDEYVALSQAVQAEAIAFAMEHFRRRQPLTAGALVWEFNDSWPAMTWSLVDFDGVPKAAYYAMARASAPLAVSLLPVANDGIELWLVNNTRAAVHVEIDVEVGTFNGAERQTSQVRGTAKPGESSMVWTGHVAQDAAHYAWASSPQNLFPPARRHFAELHALELGGGWVETDVVGDSLKILSHGYTYGVRISHPVPEVRLDDNCFDLRDGERRTVTVRGIDPALLTVTTTVPHASGAS
jgi:beta-mannosidase